MMFLDRGKKHFEEGLVFLHASHFIQALDCFHKVPSSSKFYNEALANQMAACNELGRLEESMELFQKVKEIYPVYYIALANQIQALLAFKQYSKAVSLFHQLKQCEVNEAYLPLYINTAFCAKEACDYNLLLQLCAYIKLYDANNLYCLYWQGIACYNLNNYEDAEPCLHDFICETLRTSMELSLEDIQTLDESFYSLMLLYQRTSNDKALHAYNDYEMFKLWKQGNEGIQNKQFTQAIFYLEKVAPGASIRAFVDNDLMMANVENKQSEQALRLFETIDQSTAVYPLALINYLAALLHSKQYHLARNVANKMPQEHPYFSYFSDNLFDCLLLLHDFEHLYLVSKQWYQQYPQADYQYKYALALYYKNNFQEAIEVLSKIDSWEYQEDYVDVVYLLSRCYVKTNQDELAKTYDDQAYALEHSSASAQVSNADGSKAYLYAHGRAPFDPDAIHSKHTKEIS